MNFTPEQHDAIHLDGNLVVTAGAGSGKTRVLVERYMRLLTLLAPLPMQSAPDASSILAITFTDKAAREMRDRVRATVESRARAASQQERAAWEDYRTAIESARIGTIHSFCNTLLRSHPAEAKLDPRFTTLDEVESAILLEESVEGALAQAVKSPHPIFEEYSPQEMRGILAELIRNGGEVQTALATLPPTPGELRTHWQQQLVVTQAACAADLCSDPVWVQAANTLQTIVDSAPPTDKLGSQVVAVVDWLRAIPPDSPPTDFAPITTINLRVGSKRAWSDADQLTEAKEALKTLRSLYKNASTILELQPDDALEERAAIAILDLATLYQQAVAHYAERKVAQDALDFDDLIQQTRTLLVNHPAVCARWQAELQTILVDEFQDTDNDQRAIIYALTGLTSQDAQANQANQANQTPTPHTATGSPTLPSLFIVGDGKQSIYRFRGADVSVFRGVEQDITDQGGQAVSMTTSFRTHPPLLEWINQVSQSLLFRNRDLLPYETPFEPLVAHRNAPNHTDCAELHIVAVSSQDDGNGQQAGLSVEVQREHEAMIMATRIQELVDGKAGAIVYDNESQQWRIPNYGDFALLFRASSGFDFFEQTFRAAGIPYLTTAGRGYYGRKEVQDLINMLYVLNDPMNDLALVGVLRSPLFALDDATIMRLRIANPHSIWDTLMHNGSDTSTDTDTTTDTDTSHANFHEHDPIGFARATLHDLHRIRGQVSVVELLRAILDKTGYMATISGLPDGNRRRVNVEKLLEAARRSVHAGLSDYSTYLEQLLKAEPREGEAPLEAEGVVRLMTVHRSKGLEFPIVVLPDMARKSPPRREKWLAHRGSGIALRLRGETGDWEKPLAFHLAEYEEARMERAEHERLLYVALTRARDYLMMSGPAPNSDKDGNDWLSRLIHTQGWTWAKGGPPSGTHGALQVFWHIVGGEQTQENGSEHSTDTGNGNGERTEMGTKPDEATS